MPNVHKLYGHTKGEVDLVDLIFTNSAMSMKYKRWIINAFAFISDTK